MFQFMKLPPNNLHVLPAGREQGITKKIIAFIIRKRKQKSGIEAGKSNSSAQDFALAAKSVRIP